MPEPELITEIPKGFLAEYWDHIVGNLPEEKMQCEMRQARNARIMQTAGSVNIEGLGQKMADIDSRLFFRMQRTFGNGAPLDDWIHDMLADNPQLCAPGYKPRGKQSLRHSKSFVNGVPA